jgi:tRNA threonylcarbamoyladenosine biosynthesis protein TsaB
VITLAIETSTPQGSVALLDDGCVIFSERFSADRSLGSELFTCLRRTREAAPRCDRIAIGLGPGSYSGVRIAIAAAVGLEFAWKAEVVGIPSILALDTAAEKYISVGDARRASFYYAIVENRECVEGPMLLNGEELKAALAAHASVPVFSAAPMEGMAGVGICHPSAERLASLAEQGRGISARGEIQPIYLRDPHITQARKI